MLQCATKLVPILSLREANQITDPAAKLAHLTLRIQPTTDLSNVPPQSRASPLDASCRVVICHWTVGTIGDESEYFSDSIHVALEFTPADHFFASAIIIIRIRENFHPARHGKKGTLYPIR